jgi:hypothetical protein
VYAGAIVSLTTSIQIAAMLAQRLRGSSNIDSLRALKLYEFIYSQARTSLLSGREFSHILVRSRFMVLQILRKSWLG